jgi:hypothetical protein
MHTSVLVMHMSKLEMTHAPTKHILVTLPVDALSFDARCGKGIWKHLLVSLYNVSLMNRS